MNLTTLDWHTLWFEATRYAMPRQTYASAEMAESWQRTLEKLKEQK